MSDSRLQLEHVQGLLSQGDPGAAERRARALLATEPDNHEAQYALAVAQRHQRQWAAALVTLAGILEQRPGFGRAHQEAGYNHVASRDYAAATSAFESAVAADASLINSWECLAKLHRDSGEWQKLAAVERRLDYLGALPAELRTVISYLSEARLADAERLCKHFLRAHKTHAEGMRLLAEIATRDGIHDEAEFLLESCVEFHAGHRDARLQYANVLLKTQKFAKAHEQTSLLLASHPRDAAIIQPLHAAACGGIGDSQTAVECYRALINAQPDNHLLRMSLGHVHKADGDIHEAVARYREAYRIKPDHGDAYWSLANTKSYTFSPAEVARMLSVEARPATAESDRVALCFALGSAFEGSREYQRAFHYYAKGNALKRRHGDYQPDRPDHQYHPDRLRARIDAQIEVCTAELFAARRGLGCEAPDPIFIVGLPRAGSTLLEQILSSHSQVDGTMELHNILNLAKRLRGRDGGGDPPRYPGVLAELDGGYLRRFGEQFIDNTRAYRGTAPRFIDKMPNNFIHIGLIRLILPRAKIIDARRHPMACCFSGFKQLFGEGQEFSYGLREIGNYYRQYVRLMDHWDRVLPGFVLRVQHEQVVADLEGQVRRMLDFCGLPFEASCVQYHRTARSIRTPSSEQVRQPIYRSGLEHWRNFEAWLAPLREALGPELLEGYNSESSESSEPLEPLERP